MEFEGFFRDTRINMYLSWILALSISVVLFESVLDFDLIWIIFSSVSLVLILIPPVLYRNVRVMLPWEVLLIAAIPIIVRTFQVSVLANEVATYTALAALALIIAVEMHIFTSVKFNHGFAMAFTVMSTLSLAGIWAIIRFQMDSNLGTSFLTTNEALMDEFVKVLIAGILAGGLFDLYFRRRDKVLGRKIRRVIRR